MTEALLNWLGHGPDPASVLYLGALGLVAIGVAGMVMQSNMFRIVLALAIAEAGANLLLVLAGYRWDSIAPIFVDGLTSQSMVDPVPQAMVLTAIVIGVGIQALALSLVIRIKRAYGSLDMGVVREMMRGEINHHAGVAAQVGQDRPHGERPLPAPGPNPMLSRSATPAEQEGGA